MRSQTATKMDINSFPKEVLFNLLLKVEPHEIGTVCQSKNSRVRAICSSQLFQAAYKLKYPRKLMTGKINVSVKMTYYTFTDEKGNQIIIGDNIIQYVPKKQVYPSTDKLIDFISKENPIMIHLEKSDNTGEYEMMIGREDLYYNPDLQNEERIINAFNQEVKEFLTYIERPNWYNEKINYLDKFQTGKLIKEIHDEIVDAVKDVKI